jgi:hypothetical protein
MFLSLMTQVVALMPRSIGSALRAHALALKRWTVRESNRIAIHFGSPAVVEFDIDVPDEGAIDGTQGPQ